MRHFRATPYSKARSKELRRDMTASERHLWYDYLSKHTPRFHRQRPIGPYVADFFCPDATLIIELDGDVHGGEAQIQHDDQRTHYLENYGFRIIRFRSKDIFKNFEGICAEIENAIGDPTIKGKRY